MTKFCSKISQRNAALSTEAEYIACDAKGSHLWRELKEKFGIEPAVVCGSEWQYGGDF